MIQNSSLKVWPVDIHYLIELDAAQSRKTRSQLFKIAKSLRWTWRQTQPHTYTQAASCQASATHTVAQYSLDAASLPSSLAHANRPREARQSPLQALTATTAWLEAGEHPFKVETNTCKQDGGGAQTL